MESKDRLIYANEVIEEIDEIIGNINFSSPYQNDISLIVDGLERARDCVLDAYTVDAVEIVHGRWVQDGVYDCCSICNRLTIMPHLKGLPHFKYCPNCGAKMR